MDTVTHALFGLTVYGAVNKSEINPKLKASLFTAALGASQIPDLDIVVKLTEQGNMMYQMWHRGLTHSVFMAPLWAFLISGLCYLLWKQKDKRIFYLALISVLIHIGFDALNGWGTGLFEPFSAVRVSLGVIPIVDFAIWSFIFMGFVLSFFLKSLPRHRLWKGVWSIILFYTAIQGGMAFKVYQQANTNYRKVALVADFVPGHYKVVGKNGNRVEIRTSTIWKKGKTEQSFHSHENADLNPLFRGNPRAAVLKQWSPFVVVVKEKGRLGIFDPRFYRNGSSFLSEFEDLTGKSR